jgi:hypothetical protein
MPSTVERRCFADIDGKATYLIWELFSWSNLISLLFDGKSNPP